jgi:hypothetical protein
MEFHLLTPLADSLRRVAPQHVWIVAAAVILGSAGLFAGLWMGTGEATVRGRTVRHWVSALSSVSPQVRGEARDTLRGLGADALPTLRGVADSARTRGRPDEQVEDLIALIEADLAKRPAAAAAP